MKGLKIFGIVAGGIALLVAIALALALTPSVQRWALRKAVAGQPGLKLDVGEVDAGFSATNVTDFSFAQDGVVVTAKGVSAKYSTWDYISNRRINAEQVNVNDLVIDLRKAQPTAGAAATSGKPGQPVPAGKPVAGTPGTVAAKPTPFDGLLKQLQLALDVRIGAISAKGRALLPDNQTVIFDLKGSRIEAGQRGTLEWTVDFSDSKVGAALSALRTSGSLAVRITPDRRIDLVEIEGNAAALGPKIPADKFKLSVKAEQPKAGGDETYAASLGVVRAGNVEPLVKATALWTSAAREITGTWDIGVRTEQLAAILEGLGLPEIAANGGGKYTFKPDTAAATGNGSLTVRASQLQKFSPDLAAIGSVQLTTTFDGSFANDQVRLEKLEVDMTAADGRKFAQIGLLQKVTYGLKDQSVTLANSKAEAARISLQALPLAWAKSFVKPMVIESGDLSLTFAIEAEPDGSRVRIRTVDPVALRTVTLRDAQKKILVEKLSLTVRPAIDYSKTKASAQLNDLSISLPTGDAVTGSLSADVTHLTTTPAVDFVSKLQIKVVDALKPYLPVDTGPLDIAIATDGHHEGNSLRLTKSTATVTRTGGALLVSEELLQPLQIDLKATKITVANPASLAARVRVGEIPLAWAESFVAKSKFSGSFAGTVLELSLRSLDDLTVTTAEPVKLRAVTAVIDGQTMAQSLDVSVNLAATKRGDAIAYDVKRIDVKQGDAALATMMVSGEAKLGAKPTVTAKGDIDADIPALTKQPMLAPFATLSRGRFTAAFEASAADATNAKAVITLKDLVAKQNNLSLGTLETTLTASLKADGSGSVTAPLTLTNGPRKSDISIAGTFGQSTDKQTFLFNGKILSATLVVDDFQALAALAPASTPAASTAPAPERTGTTTVIRAPRPAGATPAPSAPAGTAGVAAGKGVRETQPFWKGANGKVEVDLKRILYGKDYVISGVRGTAVITNTKLSLDGLEGRFKENPFKLSGGINFAAQLPKPYSLLASADVTNFDVGAFLRAASPDEKPALETKATVTARLNGSGANVGDLLLNAFGKFEVTGTKGVARYLARKGGASTAVNLASFGLSVLGAARGSDTASAVGELAKVLNEVQFDSLKLQVERGADLSFKLTSMEVLSPILRMTGTGALASKSNDDIQNAPMNVTLQLGAKGELGYLLQKVGMLGSNKDEKGYQLMTRTFSIGGTPAKPDSGALWKILGEAALGSLVR